VGDIYFNSGLMDKVAGSMDKAEEYYRKALSLEPDNLLNAQLICHQQAMKFLAKTRGRSRWLPGR
jgi:Tfp pilus assembly protein PilF